MERKKQGKKKPKQEAKPEPQPEIKHHGGRKKKTAFIYDPEDLDFKAPAFIEGPVALYHLSLTKDRDGIDKDMYFFGDIHRRGKGCSEDGKDGPSINVADFFSATVQANHPKTIDLFLESHFTSARFGRPGFLVYDPSCGYLLHDVAKKFASCLQVSKEGCAYKNLRAHYVDVRFAESKEDLGTPLWRLGDAVYSPKEADRQEVVNGFTLNGYITDGGFNVPEMVRRLKIDRQLQKVKHPAVRKAIESLIEDLVKAAPKVFDALVHLDDEPNPEFDKRADLVDKWMLWERFFLDAYLLGRLFAPGIQRAIVYTGLGHTDEVVMRLMTVFGHHILVQKPQPAKLSSPTEAR